MAKIMLKAISTFSEAPADPLCVVPRHSERDASVTTEFQGNGHGLFAQNGWKFQLHRETQQLDSPWHLGLLTFVSRTGRWGNMMAPSTRENK